MHSEGDPVNRSRFPVAVVIFAAVAVILGIGQWYTIAGLRSLEGRVNDIKSDVAKQREQSQNEMAELRDRSAAEGVNNLKSLEALRQEVEKARMQARTASGRTRQDALKSVEVLESRLAAAEKKDQEQHAQVSSQLSDVRQTAATAQSKIADVSSDVSSVRSEVATTRSELQRAASELRKVVGDMGVMSGHIATNGKEIAALRALGDRNYYEFNLTKTKEGIQVGGIGLLLRRSDPKRLRYTLEVRAEDRRIEKKDKTVNEPVQFYMSRSRQPYEIVVNEVAKDRVAGYLATPKVVIARE